jgi:hypothetical protein
MVQITFNFLILVSDTVTVPITKEHTGNFCLQISVVDPDQQGSETFCRILIRIWIRNSRLWIRIRNWTYISLNLRVVDPDPTFLLNPDPDPS